MSSAECALGIDVSKATLEAAQWPDKQGRRFDNDPDGYEALCEFADGFEDLELIVLEATGGYEEACAHYLRDAGYTVEVVNPRKARGFAVAVGRLEKTDSIDAVGLARFGATLQPDSLDTSNPLQRQLKQLDRKRRQFVEMRSAAKNQLQQLDHPVARETTREHIAWLDERIERLLELMLELVRSEALEDRYEVVTSAPGLAERTATQLLANLPELGELNRKEIAKLGGLAPMANDSGQLQGARSCRGGRPQVKDAMYMAALNAIRCCEPLKDFYTRLTEDRNKDTSVALIAVARKMLTMLNSMVKHDEPFDPDKLGAEQ